MSVHDAVSGMLTQERLAGLPEPKDPRESEPKRSKKDRETIARLEAERLARVRPEPEGISFAAGPICADVARTLFERLAATCATLDPEQVLAVHVHQGEQHRDGCVVTFYPIVTFAPRATCEVEGCTGKPSPLSGICEKHESASAPEGGA